MAASLTLEIVLAQGVGLVADAGWEALSLRAVASELGVTPMALYRYVPDSNALRTEVLEAIVSGAPEVGDTGDLRGDLDVWARALHKHLYRHPGTAEYLLVRWFESDEMLRRVDALLGVVADHGLEGFDAVAVANAVFTFVLMRATAERQVHSAGAANRELASSVKGLPQLGGLVDFYSTAKFEDHFDFGLNALLDGMLGVGNR